MTLGIATLALLKVDDEDDDKMIVVVLAIYRGYCWELFGRMRAMVRWVVEKTTADGLVYQQRHLEGHLPMHHRGEEEADKRPLSLGELS